MVCKNIIDLDASKASDPNCIPLVALKICKPGLSYVSADLVNIYLKGSCFLDYWKVLQ